jgi:hypothetical protein
MTINPFEGMRHPVQIAKHCAEQLEPHVNNGNKLLIMREIRDAIMAYESSHSEALRVEKDRLLNALIESEKLIIEAYNFMMSAPIYAEHYGLGDRITRYDNPTFKGDWCDRSNKIHEILSKYRKS